VLRLPCNVFSRFSEVFRTLDTITSADTTEGKSDPFSPATFGEMAGDAAIEPGDDDVVFRGHHLLDETTFNVSIGAASPYSDLDVLVDALRSFGRERGIVLSPPKNKLGKASISVRCGTLKVVITRGNSSDCSITFIRCHVCYDCYCLLAHSYFRPTFSAFTSCINALKRSSGSKINKWQFLFSLRI